MTALQILVLCIGGEQCSPASELGCLRGAFSCSLIYANVARDTSMTLLKFTALFAQ